MNSNPFVIFVDRLGNKPQLFINSNQRNVSIIGTCTTLLIACLILSIVLFYFIEFVRGSGMTVVSSKDNVNLPIEFDLNHKLFMFLFRDSQGKQVDPRIADLHASHWRFDKENSEYSFLELEQCQYGRHLSQELYEPQFKHLNVSDYLCLHPESNMTLSYDGTSIQSSHLLITVAKCTGLTKAGQECFELADIQNRLDRESYFFSYSIFNTRIDHYDFTSPLQTVPFNNNIIVTTTVSYDYSMFYKHVDYNTDRGWLLATWKKNVGYQFDESLTEKIIHTEDPPYLYDNSFGSYKFKLSPSLINKYERTFPKVPTVIANISALSKVVLLVGQLCVRFFSTAYYYVNLVLLLQTKPVPCKKQSMRDIVHLRQERSQTKIGTRKTIEGNEKILISPTLSLMWRICPNGTQRTKQVELFKKKISELLSVESLIRSVYTVEIINQNLFNKLYEHTQTNTSNSGIHLKAIPLNAINAMNGEETKPNYLRPITSLSQQQFKPLK